MAIATHPHPEVTTAPGFERVFRADFGVEIGPGPHWVGDDAGRISVSNPYRDIIKTPPPGRGYPGNGEGDGLPVGMYDSSLIHTAGGALHIPMRTPRPGQDFYASGQINPDIGWINANTAGDRLKNGFHLRMCFRVDGGPGWGVVMLLMPDGPWPDNGEYCWPEIDGATEWRTKGYHHAAREGYPVWPISAPLNARDYHSYEIIATTEDVEYRLDGQTVWHRRSDIGDVTSMLGVLQCGLSGSTRPTGDGIVDIDLIECYAKKP